MPPWIHIQNEERRYHNNLKENNNVEKIWQPTINEDGVPSINLSTSSLGGSVSEVGNIWQDQ